MAEERRCGQCGKGLPADAPGGLCPECLLKVGLQSQSQEPRGEDVEGLLPTASYGGKADGSPAEIKDVEVVLTPGQQFGGYRVGRRLGSGGMGTVYEADHLESGRRVALKVLGHRFDSPEARQRFLREGRLAASVNHPNSVYVFGTEEIAGVPVIAMELVPGGTLEERVLHQGPLAVPEAVDAILQVIDGLEAAEARGVLHRDVKAANCFVDREGAVKVGDFGLSISTSLRGDSNLTDGGTFLGTPAFSSPEQLRGDELDVRSDIYAVGVTLYYLLTGRMPYRAENLVRLIATVLEHPPRSPAELRPDLPKGLVRVVMRCLQKQPSARYRTYDELRQALAPFASAAPTPATLGLRLGAGVLDYLILAPVGTTALLLWLGDIKLMFNIRLFGSPGHSLYLAIVSLVYMLYFAVPEGLWGASAGKAICRVRVVNPRRCAAGVPKMLIRAAIYIVLPQSVAIVCAALIGVGVLSHAPLWLMNVISYSWFAMLALLFSTARRANGYAGLHDLASGTRVVLKSVYRRRPALAGADELSEETEATPTVGPYHVLAGLGERDGVEMLLGYDARLLRKVWIRRLPDDAPSVPAGVRDLARPGRLRWLAGRRAPGDSWDAYEAPSGAPLVDLVNEPQPWASVRYWLVDLAEELAAGARHGSLPEVLTLDRVWITGEGRARLLDFPAPGAEARGPVGNLPPLAGDDPEAAGLFLNAVAASALEGRPVTPDEARHRRVTIPLPLQARGVLDDLPDSQRAEDVADRLAPLLDKTPSIGRARRLAMLAVVLAPLLYMAAMLPVGLTMTQAWLREHPEMTPLFYCLDELRKLDAASEPLDDVERQRRSALEIYIAGRFGAILSDRADLFVRSFLPGKLRRLADQTLEDHPNPSEAELAGAATRLETFLDEMPDEFPGMRQWGERMPMMVVLMVVVMGVIYMAVPSLISALVFRTGPLLFLFGVALVIRNGKRASRLRVFWRALVSWSPLVLVAVFVFIVEGASAGTLLMYGAALPSIALAVWSVSMPVRGIPDRLAGTYPVPR